MGWVIRGSNPGRAKRLRPGLEPTSLLFSWYRRSFRWVRRSGREVDHSPPSGVKVKNEWNYAYIPPYTLWHGQGTVCPLLGASSLHKFFAPFVLLAPSSPSSDMMVVILLIEEIVCAAALQELYPPFTYFLVGPNADFKNGIECCCWKLGKRAVTYMVFSNVVTGVKHSPSSA